MDFSEEIQLQTSEVYAAQFMRLYKMKDGTKYLCVGIVGEGVHVIAQYPNIPRVVEYNKGSFSHKLILPKE